MQGEAAVRVKERIDNDHEYGREDEHRQPHAVGIGKGFFHASASALLCMMWMSNGMTVRPTVLPTDSAMVECTMKVKNWVRTIIS